MGGSRVLLAVALLSTTAAAVPRDVQRAIAAWNAVIDGVDPAGLSEVLSADDHVELRIGTAAPVVVDRAELQARWSAGGAHDLGFATYVLRPGRGDARRTGANFEASNRTCPEVVWTFARQGKRVVLVAIRRVFLDC